MIRQASGRRYVVPAKPANMLNRPTVVPTVEAGGQLPIRETDPYFALEISTAGIATQTKIVLFDGGRGYQLGFNFAMNPLVTITGIGADYQFILNDMVHNNSFFDNLKMRVTDLVNADHAGVALSQFARPLEVWDSSKGSSPRLVKTVYPDMGISESQYHLFINTFTSPTVVTNRTALVYMQEPNSKVTISFYQKAELGRTQ
ncbi:MAG: hypothetical protein KDD12_27125 [Lewinella sp.]|nr:hypothetical protein [Lewinella sp.]